MDPFTPEELVALKDFRARVKDLLVTDDQKEDSFLITWLRARQLNLDKAEEMLKASLEWRRVNNVDGILEREGIPDKIKSITPIAYCGNDPATGCPVFLFLLGRHDMRGIFEELGPEKFQRLNIVFMEMIRKILKEQSVKTGKPVTQFIEICDLEGYSFRQMANKATRDALISMQYMMDNNYPEIMRHATMINAPTIFYMIFNMIKPLMPKATLEKIDIQGPNPEKWKPILQAKYPMDLIPPKFGGTLKGSDEFCSQSDIWMFGPLNPRFFTTPEEDGFLKAKIQSRDKLLLDFHLSPKSDKKFLSWKFWVENYDIGFGILYEDEQVANFKKIGAEVTNEIQEGFHECKKPGKYTLVFDNTYSQMRSKTIYYQIAHTASPPVPEEK